MVSRSGKTGKGAKLAPPAGYSPVGQLSASNGVALNARGAFTPGHDAATDVRGIADAIDRINQEHAVVLIGGKTLVLHEKRDERGRFIVDFAKDYDFRLLYCNEEYQVDGAPEAVGPLWLRSKHRRQYRGVTFAPLTPAGGGAPPAAYYNLWRGYSCEPVENPKRIARFLDHMLKNVAQGNGDLFDWIMGWFAHIIQRPTERLGTALVMRGKMGTGKSKPFEVIGSLISQHYLMVDNPDHVTGKHNAHMRALLLLQADEAFWAGDKKAEGRLKSLITSSQQMIEPKGVDATAVANYVRLGATSNASFVVPAGFEERRFCVVDVGTGRMQDAGYFKAIDDDMDNGGREGLLHYLINLDLSKLNLRQIPETRALLDQKILSMRTEDAFWFEVLKRGSLLPAENEWKGEVDRDALFNAYVNFAEKLGQKHRSFSTALGMRLHELVPALRSARPERRVPVAPDPMDGNEAVTTYRVDRPRLYLFPGLEDCRRCFEDALRQEVDWGDDAK